VLIFHTHDVGDLSKEAKQTYAEIEGRRLKQYDAQFRTGGDGSVAIYEAIVVGGRDRRRQNQDAVGAVGFRGFHKLKHHRKRIANTHQDRLAAPHFLDHGTADQLLLSRGRRKDLAVVAQRHEVVRAVWRRRAGSRGAAS
jgi:hypothetical protein